jgi:hypothetical protein
MLCIFLVPFYIVKATSLAYPCNQFNYINNLSDKSIFSDFKLKDQASYLYNTTDKMKCCIYVERQPTNALIFCSIYTIQ